MTNDRASLAVATQRRLRSRSLVRAGVSTVATRGASTVVLLAVTPLLLDHLGPESYGVLVTVTSIAFVLGVADLGLGSGLVARMAAEPWGSHAARAALSSTIALSAAFTGLGITLSPFLAALLPWPQWLNAPSIGGAELRACVTVAFMGAALAMTTSLGLRIDLARQRGDIAAYWTAGSGALGPVVALVAASQDLGLTAVVAAMSFTPPMLLAVHTLTVVRRMPGKIRLRYVSVSELKLTMQTGGTLLVLSLALALTYQLDTLLVSSILGAAAAAQFSILARLFGLIATTMQAALLQFWPAVAEALKAGDFRWVGSALAATTTIAFGISAAVAAVLAAVGGDLVAIWFGEEVRPSSALLLSAAAWTIYAVSVHPFGMYLNGARLYKLQLFAAIPMAIIGFGLTIIFTSKFELAGPFISHLVAHSICTLPMLILGVRHFRAISAEVRVQSDDRGVQ